MMRQWHRLRFSGTGMPPGNQQGMALLVVLVLFAVLFTLSVEIMYEQDRARVRSINLVDWNKRWQYGLSAEVLALQALADDLERDIKDEERVDECVKEGWAITLPPSPYEDALISASVQDLQSRFNLNWLVIEQEGEWRVNTPARQAFQSFIAGFVSDTPFNAETISYEVADWIDSNTIIDGMTGAEDGEYRTHRAPNAPMAHESELRALFHFQSGAGVVMDGALPALVALPAVTPLNINSASEKVLFALLGEYGATELASEIVKKRSKTPFKSITELFALAQAASLDETQRDNLEQRLSVYSEFFQVQVEIVVNERPMRMESRIYRGQDGTIKVIGRRMLPLTEALQPACNADGGV